MGRRVDTPKKGRTRAEYNAYMREYMREWYRNRRDGKTRSGHERPRSEVAANAAFDPLRDGPLPEPCTLTAALMGDPPIGRSALDKSLSGCQRPEGNHGQ